MSHIVMNSSTIPCETFSTSYLPRDEQDYEYPPSALFSPMDELYTDFNSGFLTSPTLENAADWASLDSLSSPNLVRRTVSSASPSLNPMDLAASKLPDDIVLFGGNSMDPLSDMIDEPLFSSPQPPAHSRTSAPAANYRDARPDPSATTKSRSTKRNSVTIIPCSASPSTRSSSSGSPSPPRSAAAMASLPPKKTTAHNMIEKRYRNNLNDKISALRDAVPSLRVMVHRIEGQGSPDEDDENNSIDRCSIVSPREFEEDLGGLAPAHKLNKATILSKATEYINHLERKNRSLARENQGLRGKVDGLEMLIMNGATGMQLQPQWR